MKMTQEEYIKNDSTKCPFCCADDIEGDSIEILSNGDGSGNRRAEQQISCDRCGAVWTDVYTLTSMEVNEEPDETDLEVKKAIEAGHEEGEE